MTSGTDDSAARQDTAAPTPAAAIALRGISKAFGPVQANRDISITVARGTIHGIVGENGAGKSTLMSILYGFYRADAGEIFINGTRTDIPDSQAAIRAGIGMVFQHFKLVENFTVLENVILGAEDSALLGPSRRRARGVLRQLATDFELQVDPDALIEALSVGHQQRVEILKALYREADILILDEPTGVLTPSEADHLFRILRGLRDQGKTIILITHKLREVMDVTDDVSVMRAGRMVATRPTAQTSPTELAELMVGRKVLLRVNKTPANPGAPVLRMDGVRLVDAQGVERLRRVGFEIRAGEILGLAGVAGNGQSEILEVLAGLREAEGQAWLHERPLPLSGPECNGQARRAARIAHVPEDRHRRGLVLRFHAWENMALGYHHAPRYNPSPWFMDGAAIVSDTRARMDRFDVRPADPQLTAEGFSGGNQQKVVLAREIENTPDLLLVGQPTRGVDIGAIEFIHQRLIELRDAGAAVLLVSVELDEILALSDRILVMFDGRIMGERAADATDARELGLMMAGMETEAAPA